MILALLLLPAARAAVDVRCEGQVGATPPAWYTDDQSQLDYVLNHFALNTSFSPLHGAFPAEPGHMRLQVELDVTPGLSCERRFYHSRESTVDSNHSPVLPRPRVGFTSKPLGKVVFYGSAGFIPPIPLGDASTVTASGEAGIGIVASEKTGVSARVHYSHTRLTAHLFPPVATTDPLIRDFYDGSTFGADGIVSFKAGSVQPYLSVGYLDVSTFAWVGETSAVVNNFDPYAGMALSVGTQIDVKKFASAVEFYAVPGHLYTGRMSAGVQF